MIKFVSYYGPGRYNMQMSDGFGASVQIPLVGR